MRADADGLAAGPVARVDRPRLLERLSHVLLRPPSPEAHAEWERRLGGPLGPLVEAKLLEVLNLLA